jgi:hypothetical protein
LERLSFKLRRKENSMEDFFKAVESLVKEIKGSEEKRKKLAEIIRNSKISSSEFLEDALIKTVGKIESNFSVAGIDSGLLRKSLHGIDLILIKAVGVIFYFENNKLKNVEYYSPSAFFEPIIFQDPFSEIELDIATNIFRQTKEVKIAEKISKEFKPDFVFMDGSILPHYIPSIDKDSLLYPYYKKVIEAYKSLFSSVKASNSILAGIIEDSRASRFCNLILENLKLERELSFILEKSKDTNLLDYVLKKGERTSSFYYTSPLSLVSNQFSKEFNLREFASFYVKLSDFDSPLRVDFLNDKENAADKISSILSCLTVSEEYSMPSVLIEADIRARLSEKNLEIFYRELAGKLGFLSSVRKERRERRLL